MNTFDDLLCVAGKQLLEASGESSVAVPAVNTKQMQAKASKNEFYDEIYFDSDEEDDATNARSSRKFILKKLLTKFIYILRFHCHVFLS